MKDKAARTDPSPSPYRHDVPSLDGTATAELRACVDSFATRPPTSKWWWQRRPYLRNWAGAFGATPRTVFEPRTEEDVRWIVELARREGKVVRCFGSLHSPSDIAMTDDYMVSLDGMKEVIKIDKAQKTIQVFAGMRLHEFNKMAFLHGLSLSCLGSIVDQSIAGAISTATHSTGVGYGNLSSFVRSVTLVTADASVITLSNDRGRDVFMASLCSLGLLGVITRVEFLCEENFNLEEELFSISWDHFLDNYQRLAESDEHVRFWWFPQVREVKVSRFWRTKKPPTPKPSMLAGAYSALLNELLHPVALAVGRWFPDVLPHHAKLMYNLVHRPPYPKHASSDPLLVADRHHPAHPFRSHTSITHRVAPGPDVFVIDCGPPQYTFEGVVPYARTVAALKDLDAWFVDEAAKKGGLRPHFPVEIRPTKGDDIWLSPTYQMDGTYIGIMRPFGLSVTYRELFTGFEKRIYAFGGRPHWAKSHTCTASQLDGMFPKLADFLALRERMDPTGVFLNAYCRRHLLGEHGEEAGQDRYKLKGSHIAIARQ